MPNQNFNPASCARCRLRREECVCAHAPHLCIATRLIVVMHSKEWRRTSNTGHFARLAIQDAEVRLHGSPKQPRSVGVEAASASTLVLYPGRGARPLSLEFIESLPRPLTLMVPDGNWNQAQHMMRRLPVLRDARPVRLEGPSLELQCMRRNRVPDRMSTFEAIAQALGILEGRPTEAALLTFFQQILKRMTGNSRRSVRREPVTAS